MTHDLNQNRRTFLKSLGVGAGLAVGGAGFASRGQAASTYLPDIGKSAIESFEDGDLSEYNFATGKSGATVVSSPAYDGSKVLELANTHTQMNSTSGLDDYPKNGDIFSVWVRATNNAASVNFTYGVQNDHNRYFIRVNFSGGNISLHRYEGGTDTVLASDSAVSPSYDTWYEIKIEWCECAHSISLRDTQGNRVSHISATDTTWTDGGIGFDAFLSSGGTAYFDYVNRHENSTTKTHVVDTFEDGDLSEYTVVQNGGGASVVSSPTHAGSHALQMKGADTKLVSTGGLPHYPHAGSTFTYRFRPTGGADYINLAYGVQDANNKYLLRFNLTKGGLSLLRIENGTETQLTDKWNFSVTEDLWYEVEVDWSRNGTHEIALSHENKQNLTHCSSSDSTWNSGGIGVDAFLSNGGTVYFDSIVVNEYDDTGFGVVVEDFEDGDLGEYNITKGSSGASVTSDRPYWGNHALKLDGTDVSMVRSEQHPRDPTAGETFSCFVKAENGANAVQIGYGVQDADNRYAVRLDFANDSLALLAIKNGKKKVVSEKSSGFKLREGGYYPLEVDWLTNGEHIIRLKGAGEDVGVVGLSAKEHTWSDGGIGFDAYLANGGQAYIDSFTKEEYQPLRAGRIVDDFDDGTLDEYSFQSGKAGATLVSSPSFFGSKALKYSDTTVQMSSAVGLAAYPAAGNEIRTLVRSSNGEGQIDISYGFQDARNKYIVRVDFSGDRLQLLRYENGTRHLLNEVDGTCYIHGKQWYRVVIDWRKTGSHNIQLMNASEDTLIRFSATDSKWVDGGIGFNAIPPTNGSLFVDSILIKEGRGKLNELKAKHGSIKDVKTKQLSSNKYDRSAEITYTFKDGSTSKVVHSIAGDKQKVSYPNSNCWRKHTSEFGYQKQRIMEKSMRW